MLEQGSNNDALLSFLKSQHLANRQMGFPGRGEGVEESSHEVKTSEVNLTVLLPSVHLLLYLESLIQASVIGSLPFVSLLLGVDFHGGKSFGREAKLGTEEKSFQLYRTKESSVFFIYQREREGGKGN